jgi:outer membrane receptor for monomeric catechols
MHVNQIAGSAEDRLHLTNTITVVAGLRHDHYHINPYDALVFTTTESDSDANGWNTGVVVEPLKGLALYAQYAEASDPVNSLSNITANGGLARASLRLAEGKSQASRMEAAGVEPASESTPSRNSTCVAALVFSRLTSKSDGNRQALAPMQSRRHPSEQPVAANRLL